MFKINKIEISSQVVSELDGNRFNSESECIEWIRKCKELGITTDEFEMTIVSTNPEEQAELVRKETKRTDRLSRVDQLKAIDWSTTDSIAELKAIIKLLVKEAIRDDEN